jgi:D-alanyl-lipoteichoic acid acyltransferase DltB (MBOAT superfamily)
MVFNSFVFFAFFAIVYSLYLVLGRAWQNRLLLAASYFFYGWWDWRFAFLLVFSTVCDYFLGLALDRHEDPRRRKLWLASSMVINLGILGFFKYFDFFTDSAARLLESLGFHVSLPALHIILPVGISFYTFQSMSYVIDVYRREMKAERNPVHFALYVGFFPQLVAGPIERAKALLDQFAVDRHVTWDQVRHGATLFGWGLFKKVFIADNCARIADAFFSDVGSHSGTAAVLGVYAFAFQIYADFSGYSDMARGLSHMMGFRLMRNFNLPYFSTNPSEFWRRWHISLSTWLRDYLYIALGGNRKGELKTYRNLFTTMTLGGLWHGASWHFVIWGVYQGTLLIVHRLLSPFLSRFRIEGGFAGGTWFWLRVAVFFQFVCLGWILFRAQDLGQAWAVVSLIATDLRPDPEAWETARSLIALVWPLLLVQFLQWKWKDLNVAARLPAPAKAALASCLFYLFCVYGTATDSFIYFQF